jgi:hypothetical protein
MSMRSRLVSTPVESKIVRKKKIHENDELKKNKENRVTTEIRV